MKRIAEGLDQLVNVMDPYGAACTYPLCSDPQLKPVSFKAHVNVDDCYVVTIH